MPGDGTPFRDAEAWLAARGIEREPIRVAPAAAELRESAATAGRHATGPAPSEVADADRAADADADRAEVAGAGAPPVSARDAARLAAQSAADAALRDAEADVLPDPSAHRLEDDVAEAVAFIRQSTAAAPQAEGRLREKLAGRGAPTVVIDGAIERARAEQLVDDDAMAGALVAERRAKGHAVARIRRDLRARGFDEHTLDVALADAEREDPEAAAFAVAQAKARRLTGVATDAAYRRVLGYVVRRGYPEGLARKVAREAVFTSRDEDRTTGR